jgi:hypothetical protein
MSATTTIENFELLYLHDSMVTSFEVLTANARCRFRLHAAAVLRTKKGDQFDPLVRYAPALLTLEGVREIAFEGRYQLNATIMYIEARALPDGENVEFVFHLSGGHDADAYLVKLRIVGKDFALGPG